MERAAKNRERNRLTKQCAAINDGGKFAFLSAGDVDWASVRHKATLPVLLLLLVFGQMSGGLCMTRCESIATMAHSCGMPGMAQGHCPMCKHASANGTSVACSSPGTCSGQACNSVLELLQNRPDNEIEPLVAVVPLDIVSSPILEGDSPVRFRTARSTKSNSSFDPLISSLRI